MAIGVTKFNFGDGQGNREINPLSTAPTFVSSTSYSVGDYVYYQGTLYKCTTAHSGVWNASHFSATTVSAELQAKESEIADVKSDLSKIKPLSDEAKEALLECFRHVAFLDHDKDYYTALEEALSEESKKTLLSITAVFNQGTNAIYTDDSLDTLKQYLTVTAHYDDNTSAVVTTYALSGNLVEGTNTVTVLYGGKTTSFSVVATDFYNIKTWSVSSGNLVKTSATVDPNQNDTTMYPHRTFYRGDYNQRRNYSVMRGKTPYNIYNQTALDSEYYPIPVPSGTNHVKITMEPSNQFIYVHFVVLDESTGQYGNSITDNRIQWTQLTGGFTEKNLIPYDNMFMMINSKYDSAGTSYPVEPTNMIIEFSEV